MAIIKAYWKDDGDEHMIRIGGAVSQAILTVDEITDGEFLDCLRYKVKRKRSGLHVINEESFPYSVDVVLYVGGSFRDALDMVDEIASKGKCYDDGFLVHKGEEKGKYKYLIVLDGGMYEIIGYCD